MIATLNIMGSEFMINILIGKSITLIMITHYNTLRQKYIVDGYEEAYEYIQEMESQFKMPETLLTNFYCYIIIQAEFKAQQILAILHNCLASPDCVQSMRALTLYHIASVHFKQRNLTQCKIICQQILQQFIGLYYSIQLRLEKTSDQLTLCHQLQEILYYVFLMLAYISRKQSNSKDSNVFLEAGKRILKDRKDVMSLTTKTSTTAFQTETGSHVCGSQTPNCKKQSGKQNIGIQPIQFSRQVERLNTC